MSRARIEELLQQLQQNKLSRRSFIRSAVLLGGPWGQPKHWRPAARLPALLRRRPWL